MKKVVWIDPEGETSAVFEVVKEDEETMFLKNEFSEAEVPVWETQSLEDTYCCPQCGNIDIQEQGWFLVNKKGPTEIVDMVENAPIWCPECNGIISSGSVTCDKYEKYQ
jgi:hypothetical protein